MAGPKEIIKASFYHLGFYGLLSQVKKPRKHRLLTLMYHDILEDGSAPTKQKTGKPTRSQFSAHIGMLKNKYRVMTLEDAFAEMKSTGHLSEPTAAITFDDGYTSTYEIAFPVLKEHGVSATVYLPTGWINGEMEPWWLILSDIKKQCREHSLGAELLKRVEEATGIRMSGNHSKSGSHRSPCELMVSRIIAELECNTEETIKLVMENLKQALSGSAIHRHKAETAMSWEQAKEMADAGIRFGGHSMSHVNVGRVDPDRAEREIQGSKDEIERRLSHKVTGFAYPYGKDIENYPSLAPILEKFGFDYAVTAHPGNYTPGESVFMVHRTTLPPTSSRGLIGRLLTLDYLSDNK